MTPVLQTKLYTKDGIHNGNCFAAAIASLLDLPLWMVPPFEDMFGRTEYFMPRVDQWLKRFFGLELCYTAGHEIDELPEFYIASGKSPRNVQHAVVYSKGKMVHDPHLSGAGIAAVDGTWHLAPIEEE